MLAGAIVALLASFLAGRGSAPKCIVARAEVTDRQVKADARSEATSSVMSVGPTTVTQWRTWFTPPARPGAPPTTFTEGTTTSTATSVATTATLAAELHADAMEKLRLDVREVAAAAPRWTAGALVGIGLDGRLRWGAEVGRRLAGPLWVHVQVDVPSRAVTAGLKVEW